MKKFWSLIMGTVLFGLVPAGVHQLVKANQDDDKSNNKSNGASMVLLFTVILIILILTFSVEINAFLTQLF
ncbi:hypothetical protein ACLIA0_10620 [Bacillaceae bacterium W0354]